DGPVGLAHTRLSIIDIADGRQPMDDGDACVVFNGEIYNFVELRRDLAARGHVFRTRSDTEVLLALYRHAGLDAFERLNGMLACAIWARREQRLVLARDRLGKKPLYYAWDGERLVFASELKAILAAGVDRRIHLPALHDYLSHGTIVGDETIIDGVVRLPP